MRRLAVRLALVAGASIALGLASAGAAGAHPLGNFTTNTYAGLVVSADDVDIDYVLDLAEVPTFQVAERLGRGADGLVDDRAVAAFRAEQCRDLADGVTLAVDGEAVRLRVVATDLTLPPGEAGLDTLRLECRMVAAGSGFEGHRTVSVVDANFPDRLGWREITAVGDGTTVTDSTVPPTSASDRLRSYPEQQLRSPLDVRRASVTVQLGGGSVVGQPPVDAGESLVGGLERLSSSFTALVERQDLTVAFAALAAALAVLLGALHALAPGHGKTVMAAYLVGSRGTSRQALQLGVTVAVTHTLGVLGLGVALSTSQSIAPARLYPVLGLVSGVLFAGVGVMLLRRAVRTRRHTNDHGPAHNHGHDHGHAGGHAHGHDAPLTWRSLLAPGLAGGLVPSPSALVVLLGGIAIGRAWFGVTLVVAYGIGMAATLVGAGYLVLRARTRFAGRSPAGRLARLSTVLPVATASLIIAGGVLIAARSLGQA